MGTSLACGYVTADDDVTSWLNELAFAPIDYNVQAHKDEWSGDIGCGVQYLSMQASMRLAHSAGFVHTPEISNADMVSVLINEMNNGNRRAEQIYETMGMYLGYTIAHYDDFFDLDNILLMGGVMNGTSSEIIQNTAQMILKTEYPLLNVQITMARQSGKSSKDSQAIAAASLCAI